MNLYRFLLFNEKLGLRQSCLYVLDNNLNLYDLLKQYQLNLLLIFMYNHPQFYLSKSKIIIRTYIYLTHDSTAQENEE